MERLNQAPNNDYDTIPDVGRVEDVSFNVRDGFGAKLGSLSMGFDLPVALSPERVEKSVTAATMDSFGGGPDIEVIVAPELIAEINENGRQVLAGNKAQETDEPIQVEMLDFAEPVALEEPTSNGVEPIIYTTSEAGSNRIIEYQEISPIDNPTEIAANIFTLPDYQIGIDRTSAGESIPETAVEDRDPGQEDILIPNSNNVLNRFVKLELLAEPGSRAVVPEHDAFSEPDSSHSRRRILYLGSAGMTETIDLVQNEEIQSAVQAESLDLTVEEVLEAILAISARNQTPESLLLTVNI